MATSSNEVLSRWYTRRDVGSPEKGPYETAAVDESLRTGRLSPTTLIRAENGSEWLPIRDCSAFDSRERAERLAQQRRSNEEKEAEEEDEDDSEESPPSSDPVDGTDVSPANASWALNPYAPPAVDPDSSPTERGTPIRSCSRCGQALRGKPNRTFFGFRRLKCSSCSHVLKLPLTIVYRVVYVILAAWMAAGIFAALLRIIMTGSARFQGVEGLWMSSLIFILCLEALLRDRDLRLYAGAEEKAASQPREFSFAKALLHWLSLSFITYVLSLVALPAANLNPNKIVFNVAGVFLPSFGLSYLAQMGRPRLAWMMAGALCFLSANGLFMPVHPSPPPTRTSLEPTR
jgi:hypothetical protein